MTPLPGRRAPLRDRMEWCARLALAHAVVAFALASTWTFDAAPVGLRAFAVLEVASFAVLATAAAAIVAVLLARIVRPVASSAAQAAWWTAFVAGLAVDARVHALFGYHAFDALPALARSASPIGDLDLDARTIAIAVAALVVLFLVELCLASWTLARVESRSSRPRTTLVACAALVALPIADWSWYRVGELDRDASVALLVARSPLPLHAPSRDLDPTRVAERLEAARLRPLALPLHVPELPDLESGAAPLNVLLVVVESLRADALDPETMPRTWELARGGRRFTDHVSGGNATRFGLVSLLYGVDASATWAVEAVGPPPPLLAALQSRGWTARVLSRTALNYPRLRDVVWGTVDEHPADGDVAGERWERDAALADRFDAWMRERAERRDARPFFAFAGLDAPHWAYSWPDRATHFEPVATRVDLAVPGAETDARDALGIRNRWRNAVRFDDSIVARLVASLRATGELERTLVVVTGDHGEEFYEHGSWCHTTNFSREQVAVPLVLLGPGVPIGVETRPTAHVDVARTLLELLGADPRETARCSIGESLLAPSDVRARSFAGFDAAGLELGDAIVRVPFADGRGPIELYDRAWNRRHDASSFVLEHAREIDRWIEECGAFTR